MIVHFIGIVYYLNLAIFFAGKEKMRIALAQLNPMIGDLKGNQTQMIQAIQRAKNLGAELVLFPELAITGYPPEDLLLQDHFCEAAEESLKKIIPETKGIMAIVGALRRDDQKHLYNSAAVIENGLLLGFQDKFLLPTYDVFDEERYFHSGETNRVWSLNGKKIAVTICEDIWQHGGGVNRYVRDPIQELAALQPDLLVNLSASPFSAGRVELRLQLCQKAAQTLKCPVALCNQVGGNDSLIFDGNSLVVNAEAKLIGRAANFAEDLLLIETDSQKALELEVNGQEELYKALVLGIRDYFSKSGFSKACLGLSGGIDSALVACLAADALGARNVLAITMPSRYSSKGSVTDSKQLSKTLGIELREVSIEPLFTSYLTLLEPEFGGLPADATEENLQARLRGVVLMALSNKLGYIVLATGNKSELAMGYSTLYGDMVGGLGVIADLTKAQVYSLAEWINRNTEIIPETILRKAPSAELRPDQLDTDSLPPYNIVDSVLQDYVEEHLSPEQIASKRGYDMDLVKSLILRIHRNEYKRRQAPPSLRVSQKAFSIGRRFPIVQGWVGHPSGRHPKPPSTQTATHP